MYLKTVKHLFWLFSSLEAGQLLEAGQILPSKKGQCLCMEECLQKKVCVF